MKQISLGNRSSLSLDFGHDKAHGEQRWPQFIWVVCEGVDLEREMERGRKNQWVRER